MSSHVILHSFKSELPLCFQGLNPQYFGNVLSRREGEMKSNVCVCVCVRKAVPLTVIMCLRAPPLLLLNPLYPLIPTDRHLPT